MIDLNPSQAHFYTIHGHGCGIQWGRRSKQRALGNLEEAPELGCDGTLLSWRDPRRKFLSTVKPQRLKALRSRNCAGDHRLLKFSKQASQCCPPGKIHPRRNFCFVWSWPKGRFSPHSALLPLASLPAFLPPSAGICANSGNCSCPQLSLPGKAWEANLPGNSVSSMKILGHRSHFRNRALLQEKIRASQKELE